LYGSEKIVGDEFGGLGARESPAFAVAESGENENAGDSGGSRETNVAELIADDEGTGHVDGKISLCLIYHSGRRFAAFTRIIPLGTRNLGQVGAVVYAVEPGTSGGKLIDDPLIDGIDFHGTVVASRNAGLVGHANDPKSPPVEQLNGLGNTGHDLDPVGIPEVLPFHDYRAIAVEKRGGTASVILRW
jgi:hypothetical protein